MASALEIDGKTLYPIKDAIQETSYSRDYVTRLAREKKILATHVGRQWFVDIRSLKAYAEVATLEQEVRKKQLSAERKRERDIHAAVEQQQKVRIAQARTLHVRSVFAVFAVIGFGLTGGFVARSFFSFPIISGPQVASTQEVQLSSGGQRVQTSFALNYEKEKSSKNNFAEQNKDESEAPSFTTRSLGNIEGGILLLPNATTTATAEMMFSDRVVVQELADGTSAVVRVDVSGQKVGKPVPFVNIPVNEEEE